MATFSNSSNTDSRLGSRRRGLRYSQPSLQKIIRILFRRCLCERARMFLCYLRVLRIARLTTNSPVRSPPMNSKRPLTSKENRKRGCSQRRLDRLFADDGSLFDRIARRVRSCACRNHAPPNGELILYDIHRGRSAWARKTSIQIRRRIVRNRTRPLRPTGHRHAKRIRETEVDTVLGGGGDEEGSHGSAPYREMSCTGGTGDFYRICRFSSRLGPAIKRQQYAK